MDLLACQTHIAGCLQSLGQKSEATTLAQTALALYRRIESRVSSKPADETMLVQAQLLMPVEVLPDREVEQAARDKLRPALERLKPHPKEFAAAAQALVQRAYRARENFQLAAAMAIAAAVAEAAGDSPLLIESRIQGLDEAMHNEWRMGRLDKAEATGRAVLAAIQKDAPQHWVETSIHGRLAEISLARGRFEEAETWARKSLELIQRIGHRNTSPPFIHLLLARALQGQGKLPAALTAFEHAWKQSDAVNLRDDAGQAFYEWLAAARDSEDASLREGVARSVLESLNARDQLSLDGLHVAWRAMAHEALDDRESASKDWNLAFQQGLGDPKAHAFLALARLQQGDETGYRRICEQLVERLGTTADENARFRIAWTCAVGPHAVDDLSVPLQLASAIVKQNPENAACLCTTGALLYRLGRYDEAAEPLRQSVDAFVHDYSNQLSGFYPQYFLAMTEWRLGRQAESRQLLAELQTQYDDSINLARPWNRRAALEVLSREAERLIMPTNSGAADSQTETPLLENREQEQKETTE
jgi:tetratricopeptide (TPR) repeat protein